jgi:PhzF family phenazine biosynthesis protein
MSAVAQELAQPATAFVATSDTGVSVRWFTPVAELVLCGHGTLAAGCVLLTGSERQAVEFTTAGGRMRVARIADRYELDLPPRIYTITQDRALAKALGVVAVACGVSDDEHLVEVATQDEVTACRPDLDSVRRLARSVVITAAGEGDDDVVSRVFAPGIGIPEDQVTGSAHSGLATWWSSRLGSSFNARQASPRGGRIGVRLADGRVHLSGAAVVTARGTVDLWEPGAAGNPVTR